MATAPTTQVHEADEHTMPPFLRRVRIRGYKSIGFCDVRLHPLTILVGRNAAGKSNFLDALAFLRDVMKVGVGEAVRIRPRGSWSSLVCRFADAPRIEIEVEASFTCGRPFQRVRDNSGPSATMPSEAGPLPDLTGVTFTATYSLEFAAGPHSAPVISRESLEIADETKRLTGGFEVHNGIVQRWRSKPDASEALRLPHSTELLSVQRPDFPLLSVIGTQPFVELGEGLRWMAFYNFIPDAMRGLPMPTGGQLLDRHGQNLPSVIEGLKELEPESVQRVRDYLTVIAQEIEDFNVIRLGEYETVRFRLRGGAGEKALEFDAASMSDGTLRALAALMAAFQVVLPHGYPSIVGIEEPEAALHPAAMRALVDALDDATQRTQVLLTTHSADLLSGRDVSPGQVLVVRNRGGRTSITPLDKASREIIQKELYTLAELQRMDKLDLDEADLKRQSQPPRRLRMPLRVVVIVEGHGEDGAIRTLLERIWYELLGGDYIEVIPWRGKQGRLLLPEGEGLRPVAEAAAIKLHATERTDFRRLLLIMIDTEGRPENCPRTRAPELVAWVRQERSDAATEIACVLPNVMFETWFAAAAVSLRGKNSLPNDLPKPANPEGEGAGKGWLKSHLPRKYKETVDQPRFVGHMSLTECRDSSRSFRHLVQVLEQRLHPLPPPAPPAATAQPPVAEQE